MKKTIETFFCLVLSFYGVLFTAHLFCCIFGIEIKGTNTGAIVGCLSAILSSLCFFSLYIIKSSKD